MPDRNQAPPDFPSSAAFSDFTDSVSDARVADAAQEYLRALEAGTPLDRRAFLAQHAEIAIELAACLDGLDYVHKLTAQLPKPTAARQASLTGDFGSKPLGDFRLIREIGRGGMGVVYEAMQLSLGRRVALKVLPFAASLDAKHLQRFKNEAQAAAQLHHNHIVPVYAVGCERGVHFYAMQLVDGEPLSNLVSQLKQATALPPGELPQLSELASSLKQGSLPQPLQPVQPPRPRWDEPTENLQADTKPIPPPVLPASHAGANSSLASQRWQKSVYFRTIARLIVQAAAGLEHAHQMGVIHRDIKPANLLLDQRGNLWITDFGLAQFHAEANLTRTGDVLGTLRYMSPEQVMGDRAVMDQRTDVYSLGATLYELLTLEPIFAGVDRQALIRKVVDDEPHRPRAIDPTIPTELETIALKALSKSPTDRYTTAAELGADLQRFLDDKPILARRPTFIEEMVKWSRRHRGATVSAAVAMLVVIAGLSISTVTIAIEHAKTQKAYQGELSQRATAEANFRQARQAVDIFTQISEEEFAYRPEMESVHRRFLETALSYYDEFKTQNLDDPETKQDLAASAARVQKLLAELTLLGRFAALELLSDQRVRDEIKLTGEQWQALQSFAAGRQNRKDDSRPPDGGEPNQTNSLTGLEVSFQPPPGGRGRGRRGPAHEPFDGDPRERRPRPEEARPDQRSDRGPDSDFEDRQGRGPGPRFGSEFDGPGGGPRPGGFGHGGPGGDRRGGPRFGPPRPSGLEIPYEKQREAYAILTEAQAARLQQIGWQLRGPGAFEDPQLRAVLGLTQAQRTAINQIADERHQRTMAYIDDSVGPPTATEDTQAIWDDALKQTLAELSPAQREQWNDLIGPPFEHPWHWMPNRGWLTF